MRSLAKRKHTQWLWSPRPPLQLKMAVCADFDDVYVCYAYCTFGVKSTKIFYIYEL